MVSGAILEDDRPFGWTQRLICLYGIVWRESLRFLHQRERFISALARPLVWLFIFAAGFRQTLRVSIMPPYDTYVLYKVYIAPGLIAMIQLFNGMQSSLSMVYDREMGSMRMLLVSPAPRWFLLTSKLIAGDFAGLCVSYHRLFLGDRAADLVGLSHNSAGARVVRLDASRAWHAVVVAHQTAREFRGGDELRHFPMFFASSALYPLWRVQEGSPWLATVRRLNLFTYSVELIRFAFYEQVNWLALAVVAGCTAAFLGAAVIAYDPARGMLMRRGG